MRRPYHSGHSLHHLRAAALLEARAVKAAYILLPLLCAALLTVVVALLLPGKAFSATDAGNLRVVYGFDREFPPFTYEGPGGKPVGFEIELMQAVFQGSGVSLSFRPLQWDRVGIELSAGSITLTTGMVRTKNRERLYLFSRQPTLPLQIRLFTKIYNRFPALSLFKGQTVAVEQGSYEYRLLENYGGVNIKPFPNRVDGLRALYNDEVAAFCAPVQSAYYYINKLNYGAITTVGSPIGITEMRVAVSRDRGDVLRLVNEGMARVVESGEYDRLYRKWFVRELTDQERAVMLETAAKASIPSYVPYSKKIRGAAVLTATGKVYSACPVENADPALYLSALRAAVARAVANGDFELRAAVCVDNDGKAQKLDRNDLQTLYEFERGILVLQEKDGGGHETVMATTLLDKPVVKDIGLVYTE